MRKVVWIDYHNKKHEISNASNIIKGVKRVYSKLLLTRLTELTLFELFYKQLQLCISTIELLESKRFINELIQLKLDLMYLRIDRIVSEIDYLAKEIELLHNKREKELNKKSLYGPNYK